MSSQKETFNAKSIVFNVKGQTLKNPIGLLYGHGSILALAEGPKKVTIEKDETSGQLTLHLEEA